MELRQLRYFVMVAAERSFSRASIKLHIAQSPLSRQIQQLEKELEVPLFDRQRPIRLTEAGRFFYEHTRQVLQQIEELKTSTRRIGKGGASHLSIGFVASTLYGGLPKLIAEFRATAPNVEVLLFEMITLEQMAALKDERIDIGFGRLRFDDPAITREILYEEPLSVAVPRGHNLVHRAKKLRLADTAEEPLIIYPKAPRPSYADQVLSLYRDRGVEPRVAFEVRELQTALGLVAAGLGISIVPSSARHLRREDVSYLPLHESDLVSPIFIIYRTSDNSPWVSLMRMLVTDLKISKAPLTAEVH